MNKTYSKTEDGKLKVSESTTVEKIEEFTYEQLESQKLQCEQSIIELNKHLKYYTDLLKEADKVGVKKQP